MFVSSTFFCFVFIILFVLLAFLLLLLLNKKLRKSWQDYFRDLSYRRLKSSCVRWNGRVYWTFTVNTRHPLQAFVWAVILVVALYVNFFTSGTKYSLVAHSLTELTWDVWITLLFFVLVFVCLMYNVYLGLVRDWAVGIVMRADCFTIEYRSGKSEEHSYSEIKKIEFKLWDSGSDVKKNFFPIFYFYDVTRKLVCKGEVIDKESYLLVSRELKMHGLSYIEPDDTMETFDDPPILHGRCRK